MSIPTAEAFVMSHFILRSADLEAPCGVAEFEAACAHICQLQIEQGEGEFLSRASIALAVGLVIADAAHCD